MKRRLLATILLAMIAIPFASVQGQPINKQASWLIIPGRSYGPIEIGMGQTEIERAIGRPVRGYATGAGRWEYDGFAVVFPPNGRALFIEIDRNGAVTREGIRIKQSTINQVVRTYGDTIDNTFNPHDPAIFPRNCLTMVLEHARPSSNNSDLYLNLNYQHRGIDFELSAIGPNQPFPRVETITIAESIAQPQCRSA
jgi:hypothetical protein